MNYIDALGFVGVGFILLAYILNVTNKLESNSIQYIGLNLIGAMLACIASLLVKYYPFVLLEGTWTFVSIIALYNYWKDKKRTMT